METLPHPIALSLRRKCGDTYKGTFFYFFVCFSKMQPVKLTCLKLKLPPEESSEL